MVLGSTYRGASDYFKTIDLLGFVKPVPLFEPRPLQKKNKKTITQTNKQTNTPTNKQTISKTNIYYFRPTSQSYLAVHVENSACLPNDLTNTDQRREIDTFWRRFLKQCLDKLFHQLQQLCAPWAKNRTQTLTTGTAGWFRSKTPASAQGWSSGDCQRKHLKDYSTWLTTTTICEVTTSKRSNTGSTAQVSLFLFRFDKVDTS